jgi:hypothetical protein
MPEVFISYSHKDSEYAHRLADELRRRAIDVWIDERIDYGEQWPRVIQDNLTACKIFLLVMSTNAFNSMWVQNEVSFAQGNDKPIFPLLLEGRAWLSMAAMQYVDVRDGKMPPERFYAGLRMDLNQPTPPVRKQVKQAVSKPASPGKSKRWLYVAIPLVLCVGMMCVLAPVAWGWLSPMLTQTPPVIVKVTNAPALPSSTPKPAILPGVTNTPEPASQIYESSPNSDFTELYGLDPRGLGVRDLWFPLGASYDMDTLTQVYDDSSDLFLEYEALLVSMNGARISGYGHPEPVFIEMCLEILAENEEPAAALQADLFYCFQTNAGRYGFVLPRQVDAENGFVFDAYLFP